MSSVVPKLWKKFADVILRRAYYHYGFFDGTNKPGLACSYFRAENRCDWNAKYEEAIAECMGLPYAITFGAGRMALYAILEALDIGTGDEVILPAFTCVVVPNAILYRGAIPVYVDIRQDTFNIDVARIERAITPRTKAILAQHTFGQPCEIEAILAIAERYHLTVIEDCAHAFGGSYKGRRLGTFGHVAFASTDHSKILSTSTGGFAVCRSAELAERVRRVKAIAPLLPWHCSLRILCQYPVLAFLNRPSIYWIGCLLIGALQRVGLLFYFDDELKTAKPECYPARLSNFQAFVGWHEIRDLETNIAHRRAMARRYDERFRGARTELGDGAYLRYSLLVDSPEALESELGKYFTVGRWFSSVAQGRTTDWHLIGYCPGSCPVAEFVTAHVVNFPTHFFIDERAMKRLDALLTRCGVRAGKNGGSLKSDTDHRWHLIGLSR